MLPIFNQADVSENVRQSVVPAVQEVNPQPVSRPEPVEKTSTVKVIRKPGGSFTPSIKDALAGNAAEKKSDNEVHEAVYNEYENFNDPFTPEELAVKWKEFQTKISDRPNLLSTLSNVPDITQGNKLILKVGNSVQEEDVRQIKPELVSYLRKELRNSGIEIITSLEKIESERRIFSDSEKMQMMIQKNPLLFDLKQKFNLDFKD